MSRRKDIQAKFRAISRNNIALIALLLVAMVLPVLSLRGIDRAQHVRYLSYQLATELRQSSDDLTRLARTYVISGDDRYEKMYWDVLAIRGGEKPRPADYWRIYWDFVAADGKAPRPDTEKVPLSDLMKRAGFTDAEFAKLDEARRNSDALVKTETIAMNAVKGLYDDGTGKYTVKREPDLAMARKIMHDQSYHVEKAKIMRPIDDFLVLMDARTQAQMSTALFLGWVPPVLIALIALSLLLVNLKSRRTIEREVIEPLLQVSAEVERVAGTDLPAFTAQLEALAAGQLEAREPLKARAIEVSSDDELGAIARSVNAVLQRLHEASAACAGMTANLQRLVGEARRLTHAAVEGKLATRGDASQFQGGYREIIEGVNQTLDAVIGPLDVAARYVDDISKGQIPSKITAEYRGDFETIKRNLNRCIDAVNALVADAGTLARAGVEGHLAVRADASRHQGEFRRVVEGVNQTLDAVVGPLNVAARYVDDISRGQIPPKIDETYAGDFAKVRDNLNTCIDAIHRLVADADTLAQAAVAGHLQSRADPSLHQGDFRKIVEGVNRTLDAAVAPVAEAASVLDRLARRDLRARMDGDYRGDHARIKDSLNATGTALHDAIAQVAEAVEQVSSASTQIASSSQAVAAGASEQASSLEKTNASLEYSPKTAITPAYTKLTRIGWFVLCAGSDVNSQKSGPDKGCSGSCRKSCPIRAYAVSSIWTAFVTFTAAHARTIATNATTVIPRRPRFPPTTIGPIELSGNKGGINRTLSIVAGEDTSEPFKTKPRKHPETRPNAPYPAKPIPSRVAPSSSYKSVCCSA